ncbi:putative Ig domain-containing protein, partial [Pseudomonas sp. sp1636]|uniref:putative Ig domain-containing protein n=1 Tax=Pseudomonas sp. sp1636 TaxID=3036707 RepID=UPI0025A57D80
FEAPGDSDSNNTYVVEVTADDGRGGTDVQTITVTVTDVAEGGTQKELVVRPDPVTPLPAPSPESSQAPLLTPVANPTSGISPSTSSFILHTNIFASPLTNNPLDASTAIWSPSATYFVMGSGERAIGNSPLTAAPEVTVTTYARDGVLSFSLPTGTFEYSGGNLSALKLEAVQSDGRPLPTWLKFDPETGAFIGKVPADFAGKLSIKVIARDSQGNEAVTELEIDVTEAPAQQGSSEGVDGSAVEPAVARSSFSEQLRMADKQSALAPRLAALSHSVQVALSKT